MIVAAWPNGCDTYNSQASARAAHPDGTLVLYRYIPRNTKLGYTALCLREDGITRYPAMRATRIVRHKWEGFDLVPTTNKLKKPRPIATKADFAAFRSTNQALDNVLKALSLARPWLSFVLTCTRAPPIIALGVAGSVNAAMDMAAAHGARVMASPLADHDTLQCDVPPCWSMTKTGTLSPWR